MESHHHGPTHSTRHHLTPLERERRLADAREHVKRHARWAMGASLIPVPGADIAALTAVNLQMIKRLAEHYAIPFSEHSGKGVITALLGGIFTRYISRYAIASILKIIPVVGGVASFLSVPALSQALTQAMGKLFIQHFETGGTLLNFDAQAMRKHFHEEFEASHARAAQAAHQDSAQPST